MMLSDFAKPVRSICATVLATVCLAATAEAKVQLVTDRTIQTQRNLTSMHKLRNGIPVIVRQIPDSDIMQVNVTFGSGLKDLTPGHKALNEWLWTVMPLAAAGYPKASLFSQLEKYGIEIGCTGGIEYSTCALGTLNDYWSKALPLFAAVVTKPSMTDEDVKLTKERLIASLSDVPSDPGSYVNEIINSIFYPPGHPYRLNHDEALKELQSLQRRDLVAYHSEVTKANNLSIVVVTSQKPAKVVADLDKAFGAMASGKLTKITPVDPGFDAQHAYAFADRSLPTAYIRIKMNAPAITAKDAVAMQVVYEMLSEELGEEIRTKRSLSYAVHAFLIEYTLGIGVISASTSKPEETLQAITEVLHNFRSRAYTEEEVEEYKHGFATSYYLSQETHASLAGALAKAKFFYGDAMQYYELPRLLDKVTPADVQRLSNAWLNNLRVGVIYGRSEFKDEWALDLIHKNLKGPTAAAAAPAGKAL